MQLQGCGKRRPKVRGTLRGTLRLIPAENAGNASLRRQQTLRVTRQRETLPLKGERAAPWSGRPSLRMTSTMAATPREAMMPTSPGGWAKVRGGPPPLTTVPPIRRVFSCLRGFQGGGGAGRRAHMRGRRGGSGAHGSRDQRAHHGRFPAAEVAPTAGEDSAAGAVPGYDPKDRG